MGKSKQRAKQTQKSNQEHLDGFLTELAELCQRYNLTISGCGCCGSPFVFKQSPSNFTLSVKLHEKASDFSSLEDGTIIGDDLKPN